MTNPLNKWDTPAIAHQKKKAMGGNRGNEIVRVDGILYVCVGKHQADHWPHFDSDDYHFKPQILEKIVKDRKVILTPHVFRNGEWKRDGYIALYEISNIHVHPSSHDESKRAIEFDFTHRICSVY